MLTRKIISFITLISFIGLISGCKSNEAPKCSDPEVIATAKKISGDFLTDDKKHGEQLKKIKQEFLSVINNRVATDIVTNLESNGQITKETALALKLDPINMIFRVMLSKETGDLFFKKQNEELKNLKIESIRTLSTNKETGSHVCAGQLVYENDDARVAANIVYTSEKLEDSNDFYVTVRF